MSHGTQKPRLSVVLIARDAHDLIEQTLASVRAIADEIVVVDTGSTDRTPQLAAAAGAQVHTRPWDHDFSAARNFAWSKASGDWLLWLDAGESLSTTAAAELRQFLDTQADPKRAYAPLIVVPPEATNIAGEQVARVRLVPNRAEIRFRGRVRESLLPALDAAGMQIEQLACTIARTDRDNDPRVKVEKASRDLRLLEMEIKSHGQQPELLVSLGDAFAGLGDYSAATACYRTALRDCAKGTRVAREAYYGLLTCYDAGQPQAQIDLCAEALDVFPLDAQLLCALGGYLQAQDRLELAARSYLSALENGQLDPFVWHIVGIDEIAAICLSLVLQLQERDEQARQVLEIALTRNPGSVRARRQSIELHIRLGKRKEALDELDRLPGEIPHREALRSAIRGACLASQQNWVAAIAYLQTAYAAGCRDPLCLRWLSVSLMSTGDTQAAAPLLAQWAVLEPRNVEAQKYLEALNASVARAESDAHDPRQLRVDPPQRAPQPPSGDTAPSSATATPQRKPQMG